MTASPGKMKAIWPWYTMVDHGHMTMVDHGHMTMVDHGQPRFVKWHHGHHDHGQPWSTMLFDHGQPWYLTMVDHVIWPWLTMVDHGHDDHGQRLWCHLTKRGQPWYTMVIWYIMSCEMHNCHEDNIEFFIKSLQSNSPRFYCGVHITDRLVRLV